MYDLSIGQLVRPETRTWLYLGRRILLLGAWADASISAVSLDSIQRGSAHDAHPHTHVTDSSQPDATLSGGGGGWPGRELQ
jgi:hypothetical protein